MMTLEDLVNEPGGARAGVQHQGELTHAILFLERGGLDPDWEEELEIWLETAEAEQADPDLVLFGFHPIDEGTQVERLFYRRPSEGAEGPVYTLDVDGTAVPGSLAKFADNVDVFTPAW